jgi:hypothetical protein
MEPDGSLPSSQELSTCAYPESEQSSPQHPILSLKNLPSDLFPSGFPTNHLSDSVTLHRTVYRGSYQLVGADSLTMTSNDCHDRSPLLMTLFGSGDSGRNKLQQIQF